MKEVFQINYYEHDNKYNVYPKYVLVLADNALSAMRALQHDIQSSYDFKLHGNVAIGFDLVNGETGEVINSWTSFSIRQLTITLDADVVMLSDDESVTWYSWQYCLDLDGYGHKVLTQDACCVDESRYDYDKANHARLMNIYAAGEEFTLVPVKTLQDVIDADAAACADDDDVADDDGERLREHDDWERYYVPGEED